MKILLSAYACEPDKGSEPAVGWNIAWALSEYHEVWVLTRANNREVIENYLCAHQNPNLHFVYFDLPQWACWWKKKQRGVQLYYYLWQLAIYPLTKRLHQQVGFDLAQHVTFVNYYKPSLLAFLPIPFVWGPVGGGESAPLKFWPGFGIRGVIYEIFRNVIRMLGELDPLVRFTAHRAALSLASTQETTARLKKLGSKRIEIFSQVGLQDQEITALSQLSLPPDSPFRFISMGRLLHWKGFHLGIQAFARAKLQNAEYWIVGDGPERRRLEKLAVKLGVVSQVKFFGELPRQQALEILGQCHVLVHPSLHESGGWVVAEALAARKQIIYLNIGGPPVVTDGLGFNLNAQNKSQVINDLTNVFFNVNNLFKMDSTFKNNQNDFNAEKLSWNAKVKTICLLYKDL